MMCDVCVRLQENGTLLLNGVPYLASMAQDEEAAAAEKRKKEAEKEGKKKENQQHAAPARPNTASAKKPAVEKTPSKSAAAKAAKVSTLCSLLSFEVAAHSFWLWSDSVFRPQTPQHRCGQRQQRRVCHSGELEETENRGRWRRRPPCARPAPRLQ
jgi:hypothetical protein